MAAVSAPDGGVAAWSPARIYLVASGAFLLVLAAAGFAVNTAFPSDASRVTDAASDHIFGIFETNGWHNLAGLISGLVALTFCIRPEWARLGALVKGFGYVLVTTSIAIWGGETFLIASNAADQIVHGSLAVGGIVTGLLTPPRKRSAPDGSGGSVE